MDGGWRERERGWREREGGWRELTQVLQAGSSGVKG
jgi:hypothetical protein